MDLSSTIIPKSDQLNAEDMLSGPLTVTVESVSAGNAEQPVDFHLVEYPGRAYRPSKTMRRVIVKAWGAETDVYAGRRLTLYRDPEVKFGGMKVGGIKVSHLSHIDKAFSLALTETRGKRAMHTVEPLPNTPAPTANKPSRELMRTVQATFDTAGITDGPGKAQFIAETLGRQMNGWGDLSADDATKLLDALKAITTETGSDQGGQP